MDGLKHHDVAARRAQHGWNEFGGEEEGESILAKVVDQFKDPLILLLVGSASVSALLGQYDDAVSIVAAISIVVAVAVVQEWRSEKSLAELNRLLPPQARVVRDGAATTVLARELVVGDVVLLSHGDRVPADCLVLESSGLACDESALTGETAAFPKDAGTETAQDINDDARASTVFLGTMAVAGHARCEVVSVGRETFFGKIFELVEQSETRKTPLQKRMDQLGQQLSFVSFVIIGAIGLLGVLQGKGWLDMFTVGVSLAVAAIPEGLPICVTVTLALGVLRMARRNAIVRKLPAVECLGCATYVCVDKTGTLTTNEMVCVEVCTLGDGEPVRVRDALLDDHPYLRALFSAAALCNNAHSATEGSSATETAILAAAEQCGVDVAAERARHTRTSEVPFSSATKMMRVGYSDGETYFKGALSAVLRDCITYLTPSGVAALQQADRERAARMAAAMGRRGLRVLAVGYGSTFAGLLAMEDPPRAGVADSVRAVRESGVTVVMITGDARETAVAIARRRDPDAGDASDDEDVAHALLSGAELTAACSEPDGLHELAARVRVYYRTSPDNKQRIVAALQARGEVVAMTGDGVNDAPALVAADIGIAMGITGTDVAKEAASMILTDDDFSTIQVAIEEGKGIYFNIRNFLKFQLSTSVAALGLIALSTTLGLENPLNAMQILWINIIMDGPPAQTLGVEPVTADVMKNPPRDPSTPIVSRGLLARVLTSGAMIIACTLWVFYSELADGVVTAHDVTMTFTTFVFCDLFNAVSSRSAHKSVFALRANKPLFVALAASVAGQLLVIYWPPLNAVFQTEPLTQQDLGYVVCIASSVLIVDEVRKACCRQQQQGVMAPVGVVEKRAEDRL